MSHVIYETTGLTSTSLGESVTTQSLFVRNFRRNFEDLPDFQEKTAQDRKGLTHTFQKVHSRASRRPDDWTAQCWNDVGVPEYPLAGMAVATHSVAPIRCAPANPCASHSEPCVASRHDGNGVEPGSTDGGMRGVARG